MGLSKTNDDSLKNIYKTTFHSNINCTVYEIGQNQNADKSQNKADRLDQRQNYKMQTMNYTKVLKEFDPSGINSFFYEAK